MATPTEAEIQAQIGNAIIILDELLDFYSNDANNYITREDTLTQSLEGNFSGEVLDGVRNLRSLLNESIESGAGLLEGLFRQYGIFIKAPELDTPSIFARLFKHFIDNSLSVNSREFTFGLPAADAGNTGDGVINRLNIDKDSQEIENQHADNKVATVVRDQTSGTNEHQEVFEIRSETQGRDSLDLEANGTGIVATMNAKGIRDSLISNTSFDSTSGANPTLTIADWTIASGQANIDVEASVVYRSFVGITPQALKLTGNMRITQSLTTRGVNLNPANPYYLQIAFNRSAGPGTGDLDISIGSNLVTVNLAAQTGYNILRIPLDQNTWYDNFNQDNLTVAVELRNFAGTHILIDEILLVPFTPFDGSWYCPVGGATSWLRDDFFTWADTELGAILQKWFHRIYGVYLPHNAAGLETWAEPV